LRQRIKIDYIEDEKKVNVAIAKRNKENLNKYIDARNRFIEHNCNECKLTHAPELTFMPSDVIHSLKASIVEKCGNVNPSKDDFKLNCSPFKKNINSLCQKHFDEMYESLY